MRRSMSGLPGIGTCSSAEMRVDVRRIGGKRQLDAVLTRVNRQLAQQTGDFDRAAALEHIIKRVEPFAGFGRVELGSVFGGRLSHEVQFVRDGEAGGENHAPTRVCTGRRGTAAGHRLCRRRSRRRAVPPPRQARSIAARRALKFCHSIEPPMRARTSTSSPAAAGWRPIRCRPIDSAGGDSISCRTPTSPSCGASSRRPAATRIGERPSEYYAACMDEKAHRSEGTRPARAGAARASPR